SRASPRRSREKPHDRHRRAYHAASARPRPAFAVLSERARRRARPHGRSAGGFSGRARAWRAGAGADRHRHRAAAGLRGAGAAARDGVTGLNTSGAIDAHCRGEFQVILVIHGSDSVTVARGWRIAQMIVAAFARVELQAVASLDETARGTGGFGSTGS